MMHSNFLELISFENPNILISNAIWSFDVERKYDLEFRSVILLLIFVDFPSPVAVTVGLCLCCRWTLTIFSLIF